MHTAFAGFVMLPLAPMLVAVARTNLLLSATKPNQRACVPVAGDDVALVVALVVPSGGGGAFGYICFVAWLGCGDREHGVFTNGPEAVARD